MKISQPAFPQVTTHRRARRISLSLIATALAAATACSGASASSQKGSQPKFNLNGIKVAYAEQLDTIDVADQQFLQKLHATTVRLSANQTEITAVSRGDIDLAAVQFTDVAQALEQKALQNIEILYMGEQTIPFIFEGNSSIHSIAELAGKTVAYHSTGSLTEVMAKLLVQQNSPTIESKIHWVIVPESPNRAAALRAGRIQAAVLDYPDVVGLRTQGVKLNQLGVWTDLHGDSSAAINTVWIVRKDVFNAHPKQMHKLAQLIATAYEKFYSDKAGWIATANHELASLHYSNATLSSTYEFYRRLNLYPHLGTDPLTQQRLQQMNNFFIKYNSYKTPVPASDVAMSLIKQVATGH